MTPEQQEEFNILALAVGQLGADLQHKRLEVAHGALEGLKAIVRRIDALNDTVRAAAKPNGAGKPANDTTPAA